jgi:hypothetical protein
VSILHSKDNILAGAQSLVAYPGSGYASREKPPWLWTIYQPTIRDYD